MVKNELKLENLVMSFLVLIFVGNFLAKMSVFYFEDSFNRINGIIKLAFELVLVFYIIKNLRFEKSFLFTVLLILIAIVGNFAIGKSVSDFAKSYSSGSLFILNNYIFITIFVTATQLYEFPKSFFSRTLEVIERLILLNCIFIIIGAIFDIEFFRTYPYSARFGYNGFFVKNGEVSYLHMFIFAKYYWAYIQKNEIIWFRVLLIFIASLLIGKKIMILFLLLLFGYHLIVMSKQKKVFRVISVALIALGIFFGRTLFHNLLSLSSFWATIHNEYGLLGTITSTRSLNLEKSFDFISENWNLINYFFGGIDYLKYRVEFEFVDLLLYFGLLGSATYVYFIKRYFFSNEFLFNSLLLIVLFCSSLAGGLFISVLCMIIFYIFSQSLKVLNSD